MVLRKVGKILLFCLAGALGLILLLMLAVKLALDRVPQYQAEIKEWVHGRIGYHVDFAHVAPALHRYGLELSFEKVELRSKDNQRVLARAAGARVGADLWQFFHGGKLFALRIELDSPDIVIVRVSRDQFALASEIALGGGNTSLPTMKLDELPEGTLAIRSGVIRITNWNPALSELKLSDLNLNLRSSDRSASLRVDAQLPAVLGGTVSVQGTADGTGGLATLDWTALVRTQGLSFDAWHRMLPRYLNRVGSGSGGFEVAARGRGSSLAHADIEFDAQNVMTQLTDEPGVKFDEIAGAFTVTHSGDRWTLLGRRVRALRAGHRDPDSEFDVSWRGDDGLLELRARASYLRAETLLPLAGLLPQKDLRDRLQDAAPSGEWTDMHVDLLRAQTADPWQIDVRARFRGVGFAPAGRAPGLRGLSGTLAGTQSGGRIDLDTREGVFTWPAEYSQPVALENFKTTLYWKRTPDELLVATPSIELKTRDAAVHGLFAWRQPSDGSSPVLTLAVAVDNGNVANTKLYLPKLFIAPSGLTWLNRAFVAGHLSHADVVLQGPVRSYPFRDGSGVFLARAHIDGLTLDYKEGWPVAQNLAVLAEFRNQGMSVQLSSGHIGNLTVQGGNARFVDFKTAELQLHTTVSGDAADALMYLRSTPLDAAAEHVFSAVEASGPLQAEVDLFLPFKEFDHRHTLVRTHLHGVSLNRLGSTLTATELTGDADVDGAQVSHADVRGKIMGGSFQMQTRAPRNRPATRTILVFNGNLTGDALHSALSLPASIPLEGTTDWHAVLRMAPEPARERSLRLNGNLVGLAFDLPDPLAKPADVSLPSAVDIQWPSNGGAQIHVAMGSVLRARLSLDSDADGSKLGKLAVTFGAGPGEPLAFSDSQPVNTGGSIGRLDLAGWLKLYTPDKNAKPLTDFVRSAKFDVAQIDYLGMSFLDVSLDLAVTDAGWRIGIGGPNVVGSITLPGAAESGNPWKLDFERLKFVDGPGRAPGGATAQNTPDTAPGSGDPSGANPHGIPAVDFHAAELIWDGRQFGDVQATLRKLDDGISLQQLTVTGANFSANAQGEWRGKDAGLAHIEGTLTSTDVGATMKDLGYDAVIEAKTGKMDFDLKWAGAPTSAALSLATGHVQAALDKGQLTGIKPGAGRVMGLTSLAALPRRLELDFSDLTDKGLAFDTIRGDFELHDGSAYTDNVLVKGPAAEIGLIGRVGLKNKDYDQTAVVTGNVSSTLPLAAFAAGPVIGGAVLLFSQVFKQPLKGLARGYYRITGSWDNPIVERIKSAGAAAATAEAPK
jgi:uncharacterized protein (TIGR02099 family)